jgi:hypothetical protein
MAMATTSKTEAAMKNRSLSVKKPNNHAIRVMAMPVSLDWSRDIEDNQCFRLLFDELTLIVPSLVHLG